MMKYSLNSKILNKKLILLKDLKAIKLIKIKISKMTWFLNYIKD